MSYDEYGVILSQDESVTSRFLYNGKFGIQTDSNGLYHMRARFYNPDLKRFMNRDVLSGEVEQSQSLNRYAFVNGNPISYHDPFGLAREWLSVEFNFSEFMQSTMSDAKNTWNSWKDKANDLWFVNQIGMLANGLEGAYHLSTGDNGAAVLNAVGMVPIINTKAGGAAKKTADVVAKSEKKVYNGIHGSPGVVTGGNSTKLGKNMMSAMGLFRNTKWRGYQAQHIIPSQTRNHPVIQKIGMDLDDASNGIFLRVPSVNNISAKSRHRGYHSVYNEVVSKKLNSMDVNKNVDVLEKDVYQLQQDLKFLQESGLPLYPSQGATVELWERKLQSLRK